MKFLVDANLSPRFGAGLIDTGHEAVHVRDVGLLTASDQAIYEFAKTNEYVIVSADSDFGTLLAKTNANAPSFILLRHTNDLTVGAQIALLLDNLVGLTDELAVGSVVTLSPSRIRVRKLPFV